MIKKGTKPEDAVKDLDLIHVKDAYLTNEKPVHWSGMDEAEIPEYGDGDTKNSLKFLDLLRGDQNTLAIWKGNGKIVIAWVEA